MIIYNIPINQNLVKEPFILNWLEILSGQYKGNWATSQSNLKNFPEIFQNLTYEIAELDTSAFQVDYTPPTLTPYAVLIPEVYQWAFPENKFVLVGFEIPLDDHNSDKVVNVAYFMWQEFRNELDSGNHEYLKRALMPLWDYVSEQVTNNNLIQI